MNRAGDGRKKILIIDDDADLIEVYKARLELNGYRVIGETDPHEARWIIRQELPDLILLDLGMPHMSGFELLTGLPSEFGAKQIPVFIFTAFGDEANKLEARELGAAGFFVKGQDEIRLFEGIKTVLG